jgi:hypothetical protein
MHNLFETATWKLQQKEYKKENSHKEHKEIKEKIDL